MLFADAAAWSFIPMTATHEAKLSELQNRVVAIDADLKALDDEYIGLASRFDSGNKHLLQQAEQLEQRRTALVRDKALTLAAAGVLAKQQEAEQQQAQQAEQRKQLLEAKQLGDQVASLHVDLDRMLVGLREAFAKRANLLRALAGTGQCNADWINKLLGKASPTRACCHARLHDVIAMEVPSSSSFVPLASSNPILLAIGKDVEEQAEQANNVPRRRLNGE
jgi:hypothetical protein